MIRAVKTRIKHLVSPKYAYLNKFLVRSGDVVVDFGANVGEVAEYFLARGARVEAYEPNPYALELLERRIGRNRNARIFPVAVSDFTGKSKLWLHKLHRESEVLYSQGGSLRPEKANVSEDYVEIDVLGIADVLERYAHIRLLKIDIEGGEYEIMDDVLKNMNKIDIVLLETHESKGEGFRQKNETLMDKIEKSGFRDRIFTDWF